MTQQGFELKRRLCRHHSPRGKGLAQTVQVGELRDYWKEIGTTTVEHDNEAADFINDNSIGLSLWNRRAL